MPKCSFDGVYISNRADLSSASLRLLGTERRNKTSISSGTPRAVTIFFVVVDLSPSESASCISSLW
jgi:hypothetical protein